MVAVSSPQIEGVGSERMQPRRRAFVVALAASCVVVVVRFALGGILGGFVPLVPFSAAVAIAAWYGGLVPGLLATVLSGIAADYVFVPERYALGVDAPRAVAGLAVFALVGILISALCESLHRMRQRLETERAMLRTTVAVETRMHRSLEQSELRERARVVQLEALTKTLTDSDRRKNEFLVTIAHELRNPLTPVRNVVHFVRAKAIASPDLHWVAELLDRQVGQMTRLVDDLMEVARISRGDFELRLRRTELAPILLGAVEAVQPLIDAEGHLLTVSLPPDPVYLDADTVRLSQVFSNLLSNAAKYTERGGRISVDCGRREDAIEICVNDTGIGIPADMLELIFEPFMQLDVARQRARGGLGIGLALARRLVHLHGGTLTAHSDGPGQGSALSVHLPLARPADD